jgi:PAS domain S-box-containing protein
LPDTSPIQLTILSRQQDDVEIINSTLRNAGHLVHCTWVRELAELSDSLGSNAPELLFARVTSPAEIEAAMEVRSRHASGIPVVLIRDALTEADLCAAIDAGAQDVVNLQSSSRLQAVATRELHIARLDRALAGTLASARQYRDQVKAFMTGSTDAIANVQEGIIVDVNPAWIELFGQTGPDNLLGQPLMDLFDPQSHAALKGALVAAVQGRWSGHKLATIAATESGTEMHLDLHLEQIEFEGDPAVRLRILTQQRDLEALTQQLEEALRYDAATGLLKRAAFLERAKEMAAKPLKGGIRSVIYVEPDKFAGLEAELGPLLVEDLMEALGTLVHGQIQPGDTVGRVSMRGIALLVERGNTRDLEAWLDHLLQRVSSHVFQIGKRSVSISCSAGTATCNAKGESLELPLDAAIEAQRQSSSTGGGRRAHEKKAVEADAARADDQAWAARIKNALLANRFRLVQQPIASLVGEETEMYDLLVRMLDEKGDEVLPSEFLAAAERTDLMKNIDRWVIGAAMSFCAARKPNHVFVRLSRDSVLDRTLGNWLQQQVKSSKVDPGRMVFEVAEDVATRHLKELKELQGLLSSNGFGIGIENFGSSHDPGRLLDHVPVDYLKIDGSLMQGLANDRPLQDRVKALVDQASEHNIATIAERVEDANTMAVLWQLGIGFIQGYFVNSPEEVVLGS